MAADVFIPGSGNPYVINTDQASPRYFEGLQEGFINASNDQNSPNPLNSSPELGLRMATTTAFGTDLWANPRTWIYTGQIFTGANGIISFAANNDDTDFLRIDGITRINDGAYNTTIATVVNGLTPNSWVSFEYRVSDTGAGGAGPSAQNINGATGWTNTIGAVISFDDEGGSLDANAYTFGLGGAGSYEVANGTPELFRYQSGFGFSDNLRVTGSGAITLDGQNAELVEPSLRFETTGATLTVNDGSGVHKTLGFSTGTTLATANGQANTINGTSDVRLGTISDGGFTNVSLTYAGTGRLILDSESGNSAAGATIGAGTDARVSISGNGAATLGALAINGAGGILSFGGVLGATYDVPIVANQSGTLEHTVSSADTIGGNGGITVASGRTLTVNNSGGLLTIAGAVTGGGVQKTGPNEVRYSNTVNLASYTNTTGTSTMAGATTIGTLTNDAGATTINGTAALTTVVVNAGRVEVNGPTTLTNNPTIAAGATLALLDGSGTNVVPTTITIPTGTLQVNAGALGGATHSVALTGGTLDIIGNSAGLSTYLYGGNDGGANASFGAYNTYLDYFNSRGMVVGQNGLEVVTQSTAGGITELNFPENGGQMFAPYGQTRVDNIVARFQGKITIAEAGTYVFGTASDDGSVVFIDGSPVVQNNFYQGVTRREGTIDLTAGDHQIEIGFYEGGGGNSLVVDWTGPNFNTQNLPNAVLSSGGALNFVNPITVSQDSTINISGINSRSVASSITVASGKKLTVSGGELTATTLNMVSGTIDAIGTFIVKQFATAGSAINILKTGSGILALDPSTPHLQNGGTITVQAGQIGLQLGGTVAPLGNATVNFQGGGLALSSSGGDQSFTLPNLTGDQIITARPFGSGVTDPTVITLNGNLSVGAGRSITLGSEGNYTLRVGGTATGAGVGTNGRAIISGGTVIATTNTALQNLNLTVGTGAAASNLQFTANNPTIGSLSHAGTGAASIVVGSGSGNAVLTLGGLTAGSSTYKGSINPATGSSLQIVKAGAGTQRLDGPLGSDSVTVSGGILQLSSAALGTQNINLAGGTIQFADQGLLLNIYDSDPNASGAYNGSLNTLAGVQAHFAALTPAITVNTTANNNQVISYLDPTNNGQNGAPFRIHGSNDVDTIEALFTGQFLAETTGSYTFHPRSDDGTNVFIDGNLLVNNNVPQGLDENNQAGRDRSITLSAGYHNIAITFNEGGGGAVMNVGVTTPTSPRRLLNNSELFTADQTIANAVTVGPAGGTIDGIGGNLTFTNQITGNGTLNLANGRFTLDGGAATSRVNVAANTTLRVTNTVATTAGTTIARGGVLELSTANVTGGVTVDGGLVRAVANNVGGFADAGAISFTPYNAGTTSDALLGRFLGTGGEFVPSLYPGNTVAGLTAALTLPALERVQTEAVAYTEDGVFAANFPGAVTNQRYTAAFSGKFTASATGTFQFQAAGVDDTAGIWVDLNQNGVFEANGSAGSELISQKTCCGDGDVGSVELVAGQSYRFAAAVEDTGGGGSLTVRATTAPGGSLDTVNPASQPGVFSYDNPTGGGMVEVQAGAELRARSISGARDVVVEGTLNLNSTTASTSTVEVLRNVSQNGTLNTNANNTLVANHLTIAPQTTFIKAGSGTLDVNAQSIGSGGILQVDGGVAVLRGTASASNGVANNGQVLVNAAGTLDIRGVISGDVIVDSGRITGNGTVGTLTALGGTVAPGAGAGTLTTGTLVSSNTTNFEMQIGGTVEQGLFDQLHVTGDTLDLNNAKLTLIPTQLLRVNDVLTIILNDGLDTTTGQFQNLANGSLINLAGGQQVRISYFDDASTPGLELTGGNDVSLLVTIPEPSTFVTLLGGLGTLAGLRRFRRRTQESVC